MSILVARCGERAADGPPETGRCAGDQNAHDCLRCAGLLDIAGVLPFLWRWLALQEGITALAKSNSITPAARRQL